jgi:hypothetical protein
MNTPKPEWTAAKSIASGLLRIATSPLVLRTVFFFVLFLAMLLALFFKVGFPSGLLCVLGLPTLMLFSGALALRTLRNSQPVAVQGPQVYDKAKYHSDGDFPKGLPHRQAFVHTGMFVGWLIDHDMIDKGFLEETEGFKERKVTGAQVYKAWDGCLNSDMLTEEGNAFAKYYYNGEDGHGGPYFEDYEASLVGDLPSLYHVKDTWENYGTIKKRIDERYEAWKKQK